MNPLVFSADSESLLQKTLILIGAGHAHVAVIRRFAMRPLKGIRLIIVSPESVTPYSGMLPGFLAGNYDESSLFLDVAQLAERAGAWFIRAEIESIDAQKKRVTVRRLKSLSGDVLPSLGYDWASINTGAAPSNAFPSTHRSLFYIKPITALLSQLNVIDQNMSSGTGNRLVIVGGGAAGIELAFSFRARYGTKPSIRLVTRGRFEMDAALSSAADSIRKSLRSRGIEIEEGAIVAFAEPGRIRYDDGRSCEADVVVVTTPVAAPGWLSQSELPLSKDGFLLVDRYLNVPGCDGLFAAGDVVEMSDPKPRSGVMAVRAGQYLAKALVNRIKSRTVSPFIAQRKWLMILNRGDETGIAIKGRWHAEGRWVFWLKDWIDQRFMKRFQMSQLMTDQPMRCEGCASKLPGGVLRQVFGTRFEDAVIDQLPNGNRLRTLDGLTYLLKDPHLMGLLAMRHSVSDIWAMGGKPVSALTMVGVNRTGNSDLEAEEFTQVVKGLEHGAERYGVQLRGGHSLALEQAVVAVSVEGLVEKSLPKQGAKSGDVFVLSGPLGSGLLMAGFQMGLVSGAELDKWIVLASESLQDASEHAVRLGAHAMTDVTGFGLAGHLAEMLGDGATFEWSRTIPAFSGVESLVASGVESTQAPSNRVYAGLLGGNAPSSIVFDPQTAGPLLVALSEEDSIELLSAWRKIGLSPAVIGRLTTKTS
ncbi:selenide, water dikinase SelD [Litorivicinus sp.]|nr:selenide, water dikinase SelD [Litorivicinus sp.]